MVAMHDDDACWWWWWWLWVRRSWMCFVLILLMVTVVRCPLIGSWFMCGVYVLLLVSRDLRLQFNGINGTIPSTIGSLTRLTYVHTTSWYVHACVQWCLCRLDSSAINCSLCVWWWFFLITLTHCDDDDDDAIDDIDACSWWYWILFALGTDDCDAS